MLVTSAWDGLRMLTLEASVSRAIAKILIRKPVKMIFEFGLINKSCCCSHSSSS